MTAKPRNKVTTPDEYLAHIRKDQRAALQKLRRIIHAAAPGVEECISYGLFAFRLDGRALAYLGATSKHCAFYPGSGATVAAHKQELAAYDTSKGAVRFQPAEPLPAALMRKLVRFRIAENKANGSKR